MRIIIFVISFIVSSSFAQSPKNSERHQWKFSYYTLDKAVIFNFENNRKVARLKLTVMTQYDERVLKNVKIHEVALGAVVVEAMRSKTEADFREKALQKKLFIDVRDRINATLEKHEGFGGIEEIFFPELELYDAADTPRIKVLELSRANLRRSVVDRQGRKEKNGKAYLNFYSLDRPLLSNIAGSRKALQFYVTITTEYDDRVIQNIKVHEMAIRSGLIGLMRQKNEGDLARPDFRNVIAEQMRQVVNSILEENEGFGGIKNILVEEYVVLDSILDLQPRNLDDQRRVQEEVVKGGQVANQLDAEKGASPISGNSRRLALVIGNSNYSNLPKLPNTLNDNRAISNALRNVGFQVSSYNDMDLAGMQNAIRSFGEKLGKGDVGLFYYAGHAVQVKGKNYLIPIKENIRRSFEVPASAIDIDLILATLESVKNDLNIVVLDSCRSSFPGEARGTNRGLATIEAAKGTFIAFATAPGKEALDGSGSNSPYTKHLSKLIGKKGLPLEQVFKEVRKAVVAETNGEQVPWENSSLMGDFYFQK